MTVVSTSRLDGPEGPCAYCDADRITSFNWAYAARHPLGKLAALRRHLDTEIDLKWGTLLRCPTCAQAWYLDGDGGVASRVPRSGEPLLRAWSEARVTLSAGHLAALERIRAAGEDKYGNGRGYLHFPCAIRWRDGSASDPAILVVTKFPPLGDGFPGARLFDPSATILDSDYALPLDVRRATRRADEQRMGLAPTPVAGPDGRVLLLNWSADVFDREGVKGKDVRLCSKSWGMESLPPIVSRPDAVVFAFADWFDGAERLAG